MRINPGPGALDFDDEGLQIPAFWFRPASTEGKVPIVVYVHGGPESQLRLDFSPFTQYLVDRGYAVLAPNVRGSTGYGKRYHHLDDRERRASTGCGPSRMSTRAGSP